MHDRSVVLRGQRFHYTEWGEPLAPAVVLLHGITGHARAWDGEGGALAPRFRVLALDQRGHGDSDPAPDGDYTLAAMAGDLAAFVDALALGPLSVVGLSMGGRVAITYAADHPERVERLMVIDIGPEIAAAGQKRVLGAMAHSPERFASAEEAMAYARATNPRYTDALLRHRIRHGLRALPAGGFTWKYDRALREQVRAGGRREPLDLWSRWAALECPTLLVRGAESDILSPEIAKRMLEALRDARLIEVPGAGHTVPGDQPGQFQALLRDFLGWP